MVFTFLPFYHKWLDANLLTIIMTCIKLITMKDPLLLIKNVLVLLLFAFAMYLSLIAVVAVPVLQGSDLSKSALSVDLADELNAYIEIDSIYKKSYFDFVDKQKEMLIADTIALTDFAPFRNTFDRYKEEVDLTFRELALIKERAINRMELTDNSILNQRLRQVDKADLFEWYAKNRSAMLNHIGALRTQIGIHTNELVLNENEGTVFTAIDKLMNDTMLGKRPAASVIPVRPPIGSDLGFFQRIAGWLTSSESYHLTIIIGLFGFGLLGAGGSTFIKEQEGTSATKPILTDLIKVFVKGFTAAIVIFLAVKGSLSVLSTNNAEPNPYALFFVTFVAAVFNEESWSWAKDKFLGLFGKQKPDTQQS